jgi:basic amino acid/polyamine antiporter, APA family
VVISYSVAALAALISALSYTEFVVDLPTAGGAYNYISLVFGELTAW